MKVLFIMFIVVLLVAFAAQVFADPKGDPNENAWFGQQHKLVAATGSVSDMVHLGQESVEFMGVKNFGQLIKMMK